MTNINAERRIEGDWHPIPIPPNVHWGDGVFIETAQIFRFNRSKHERSIELGNHVSAYAGCSFSLGPNGRVKIGDFTLLNGAILMSEESIEIGAYCLISWNVGIADSDFHPLDAAARRVDAMALAPYLPDRPPRPIIKTKPVVIEDDVWIGMGAIILKGVRIGRGSVVAAGALVTKNVPPNTVVAGNPAVVVKHLENGAVRTAELHHVGIAEAPIASAEPAAEA